MRCDTNPTASFMVVKEMGGGVWGGAINVFCSEIENQLAFPASRSLCGQFQHENIAKGNRAIPDTQRLNITIGRPKNEGLTIKRLLLFGK
jgi:hypothetical protein